MTKEEKLSLLWLVAGAIFILVSIRDIFFEGGANKSGMIISFEVIAGVCFVVLAFNQWKKHKPKKAA